MSRNHQLWQAANGNQAPQHPDYRENLLRKPSLFGSRTPAGVSALQESQRWNSLQMSEEHNASVSNTRALQSAQQQQAERAIYYDEEERDETNESANAQKSLLAQSLLAANESRALWQHRMTPMYQQQQQQQQQQHSRLPNHPPLSGFGGAGGARRNDTYEAWLHAKSITPSATAAPVGGHPSMGVGYPPGAARTAHSNWIYPGGQKGMLGYDAENAPPPPNMPSTYRPREEDAKAVVSARPKKRSAAAFSSGTSPPAEPVLRKKPKQTRAVPQLAPPTASSAATRKERTDTSALDFLCSAALEMGPVKTVAPVIPKDPTKVNESHNGCSCSKSHCIKLYCECFKAGIHCDEKCACANCKNTTAESGMEGERTKAIKATLSRNPLAFTNAQKELPQPSPGETACRCIKSKCLKLYCDCFQTKKVCNISCSCVGCLNTVEESGDGGRRKYAIDQCLEKRSDAFKKKVKEVGSGCACKNNRCLKKYCDCFRFDLICGAQCSCKDCGNNEEGGNADETM